MPSFPKLGLTSSKPNMDAFVKIKPMDVCKASCEFRGRKKLARKSMIQCAMCDRYHHFECIGFSGGNRNSVRGVYLCTACVQDLRRKEQRLAAVEDTLAVFHAEFLLLKGLWEKSLERARPAPAPSILGAAYVALIQENAELKQRLGHLSTPEVNDSVTKQENQYSKAAITPISLKSSDSKLSAVDGAKNNVKRSVSTSSSEVVRDSYVKRGPGRPPVLKNAVPKYKCKKCDTRFNCSSSLYRHTSRAHKSSPLQRQKFMGRPAGDMDSRPLVKSLMAYSGDCYRRQYLAKGRLNTEKKGAKEDTARCDTCGQVFLQKSAMLEHVRLKHGNQERDEESKEGLKKNGATKLNVPAEDGLLIPKTERIDSADETEECADGDISAGFNAKKHNKRKEYCEPCDRYFASVQTYKFHCFKDHNGPSPFTCTLCQKPFGSVKSLDYHLLHHDAETFPCRLCKLHYILNAHLKLHNMYGCGVNRGNKPTVFSGQCKCEFCFKSFPKKWRLTMHLKGGCKAQKIAESKKEADTTPSKSDKTERAKPTSTWTDIMPAKIGPLMKDQATNDRKCNYSARSASNEDNTIESDHFLHCQDCDQTFLGECLLHPMQRVHDAEVDPNDACRAYNSLPPGLSISKSFIEGAGLGVWADTAIPKGIVFGPYLGRVTYDVKETVTSDYTWQVPQTLGKSFYIDGKDVACSNWMRLINCADNDELQNLTAIQFQGEIFYRTIKPIPANRELLVWYGEAYAKVLGLIEKDKDESEDSDDEKEQLSSGGLRKQRSDSDSSASTSVDVLMVTDDELEATKRTTITVSPPSPSDEIKRGADTLTSPTSPAPKIKRLRLMPECSSDDESDSKDRNSEDGSRPTSPIDDDAQLTPERLNFACRICDRRFAKLSHMRLHARQHALGKRDQRCLRCPNCPMRFDTKEKVDAHVLGDHNLPDHASDGDEDVADELSKNKEKSRSLATNSSKEKSERPRLSGKKAVEESETTSSENDDSASHKYDEFESDLERRMTDKTRRSSGSSQTAELWTSPRSAKRNHNDSMDDSASEMDRSFSPRRSRNSSQATNTDNLIATWISCKRSPNKEETNRLHSSNDCQETVECSVSDVCRDSCNSSDLRGNLITSDQPTNAKAVTQTSSGHRSSNGEEISVPRMSEDASESATTDDVIEDSCKSNDMIEGDVICPNLPTNTEDEVATRTVPERSSNEREIVRTQLLNDTLDAQKIQRSTRAGDVSDSTCISDNSVDSIRRNSPTNVEDGIATCATNTSSGHEDSCDNDNCDPNVESFSCQIGDNVGGTNGENLLKSLSSSPGVASDKLSESVERVPRASTVSNDKPDSTISETLLMSGCPPSILDRTTMNETAAPSVSVSNDVEASIPYQQRVSIATPAVDSDRGERSPTEKPTSDIESKVFPLTEKPANIYKMRRDCNDDCWTDDVEVNNFSDTPEIPFAVSPESSTVSLSDIVSVAISPRSLARVVQRLLDED